MLAIAGATGPDYLIQASTDLVCWTTALATHSPPMPLFWSDSNAAAFPQRFYRALLAP